MRYPIIAMGNSKRTARAKNTSKREPVIALHVFEGNRPIWSFSILDIGDRWCWGRMDSTTLVEVLTKLKGFEAMDWREIKETGSHSVKVANLSKDARNRLAVLHLDDYDDIYSLRFTGKKRIYGLKDKDILRILWWDSEHEIYPVELHGT
jgi:hypothetical protein